MNLDGRTLLFSTAITLVILVSIVLSIRRSMENSNAGLGWFAMANVTLTTGCVLLGLRGFIPDWLSMLFGNTCLVAAAAQFLVAFQQFDARRVTPSLLIVAPTALLAYLAFFYYVVDHQPLRVAGVMTALALLFGASAWTVIRQRPRTFARVLASSSLFLVASAFAARLAAVVLASSAQQSALFGGSTSGNGVLAAACVLSQTSAVGFILMVNDKLRAQLSHLATHDALTGLFSRGAFLAMAAREVQRAKRKGDHFSIVLLDIDHFKRINDTYGHQAGDLALEAFAAVCSGVLRRSDFMGRYGGEEFIALLPDATADHAMMVSERLRSAIEHHPVSTDRGLVKMTCSIGVACSRTFGLDLDALIAAADRAMYMAKSSDRNRVCCATQEAPVRDDSPQAPTLAASVDRFTFLPPVTADARGHGVLTSTTPSASAPTSTSMSTTAPTWPNAMLETA